jgi:hypothetical protein
VWKRFFLVVAVIGCAFSCRDIQPFQPLKLIQGYELNGLVVSSGGLPVDNVDVRLYYNYDIVGTTPIDTQKVIVTDPSTIVDIAVYTQTFNRVRELYLGTMPVGTVPRMQWDGRNDSGAFEPPGKYLVRYVLDAVVVKYSTEILEGTHTATTDSLGRFTISNSRFPIGEIFDNYLQNNTYDATYRVRSDVDIVLRKVGFQSVYNQTISKDKQTTVVFTLE